MDELTDDELMVMFRNGDKETFEVLFDRHHVSVYNFACTMLRDRHRAEDVLQETFLAVARAAGRYKSRGHFRTWMMRICRNRCLGLMQSERLRRAVVAGTDLEIVQPVSPEASPPDRLRAQEEMACVREGISALPERQREAIVLYAFEQMSYRDVSEVLDVPMGTVKTLIHRARAALAQAVEGTGREKDAV